MIRSTLIGLALIAGSAGADSLYDAAAAAERQAAAQAVLAATAAPGGPLITADGVHCTAQSAVAIPPTVRLIDCRADRVTLGRDGLSPELAGVLLHAAQIWARGVAAPPPPEP